MRERDADRAALGAGGEDLLVLVEEPGAKPADGFSGLYHFALLVPDRADLARWLAHAARDRVQLVGMSDHFVSEALYLRDPDHHGIEIYADRPRELWEGQVWQRMTSLPLDTDDLVRSWTVRRARRSTDCRRAPSWATCTYGSPRSRRPWRSTATSSASRLWRSSAHTRRSSAPGATTIISARTRGRARVQARHRPATRRSATRRSCVPSADTRDALVERAGGAVDEVDGSPVIRDPSGNRLALATA